MSQAASAKKHVTTRTVWLTVLSSFLIGVASLFVGLSIYGNSLMQESIARARSATTRAASSATHGTNTVGLAREVMEVYNGLTPAQRRKTGTEEYRQLFQGLSTLSPHGSPYAVLINMVRNFMTDVDRIYICSFDRTRGAMVYLMDSNGENSASPGDWEAVPEGWIEKVTTFPDYDWAEGITPYDIRNMKSGERICVTAFPIQDETTGENPAYLVAELSLNAVVTKIIDYALKVSVVVLALTLLIAYLVGMLMKRTVADPINAIAKAARTYVRDRKNNTDRADHFSSLNIRTGDELENLSNTMADMERELIAHEDQIEALLDSLVKALSTAIDDRSHYTGKHTHNMVIMAERFLDWMEIQGNPWHYDEIHRRVFIMSVGLHDIGKLTVPLEIMDKSTRLGPELNPILERFSRMRLLNQIEMLAGRATQAEYNQKKAEADRILAFILRINKVGFLSDVDLAQVNRLAACTFVDEDGREHRLLTDEEITMLSIRKGTLTPAERTLMQGHVTSTWNILKQVDFPDQYANIPRWAAAHHELLQGKGYPNGISGDSIPREVRLLTILDIFEALTAKDRPYKSPFTIEKAWSILEDMVKDGSLDGKLVSMFRESRAWEILLSHDQEEDQERAAG